ncbi:hypothetical protein KI387_026057 [Taxus chinensis]|uniref:Uncharacterized protein n=1 Tax=Taxus chinensis TaxID=29808 RepID=A0AA38FV39_TAXCH|nr:hypothetical protein KI387_026057 [Taxus chinensis]
MEEIGLDSKALNEDAIIEGFLLSVKELKLANESTMIDKRGREEEVVVKISPPRVNFDNMHQKLQKGK